MSTLWEIYFSISHSQNFLETPQTWFAGSDFLGNCWRCRISRNPYVNKGPEEGVENNDMSHVTVCSFCTTRCMSAWGTSYGALNCSSLQGMNHWTAHTKLDTRPIPPAAGAAVQHPRYASISKRVARPTSLLLRFSSQLLVPLVSVTTAQSYPPNHLFSFPFLPPRRGWSQEPGEPQIRSPPLRLLPWTSKSFQSKYCTSMYSPRAGPRIIG